MRELAEGSIYSILRKRLDAIGDPSGVAAALNSSGVAGERREYLVRAIKGAIFAARENPEKHGWAVGYIQRVIEEIEEWEDPSRLLDRVKKVKSMLSGEPVATYNPADGG